MINSPIVFSFKKFFLSENRVVLFFLILYNLYCELNFYLYIITLYIILIRLIYARL